MKKATVAVKIERSKKPPGKQAVLHPDYFLVGMVRQLASNYRRMPSHLYGARIFFLVHDEAGAIEYRTLVIDEMKPRLYEGLSVPENSESCPFLQIELSRVQLAQFFTGALDPSDPANEGVQFFGNSEELYQAIGTCL